jgi:hypothetical protein
MILQSRFLLIAVVLSLAAARAQGQTELAGRVVDDLGKPIAGAAVTLTSVRYTVSTDSLGRFRLTGTAGSTLELSLKAAGFRDETASVVLSRARSTIRDFVMVSDAVPLPEVSIADRVLHIRITTNSNEPIAYANLQVNGGRRYVSNDTGRVALPMPGGARATLLVRRIGFEPTEITLSEIPDTAIQIRMKPVATTLERQLVTVRSPFVRLDLGGFYRRMDEVQNGARVGYFMTPEDLALRRPQNVTDAVEHFPNIRLAPIDDGKIDREGYAHADGSMSRRKFRIEDRTGCPFTVYLDRVRIQPASMSGGKVQDAEINSMIQVQSVAGIEVYPRASGAPPEFPPVNAVSITSCGVVLIWTK